MSRLSLYIYFKQKYMLTCTHMHMNRHHDMQTHARSQPVKWVELTRSPSPRLAVFTTRAPLLRPVGILQMAIKMHEVCWNRGEELSHLSRKNKTSEREKKKQVECVAKLILQGLRRELQTSAAPLRLLVCTSENWGCASCYPSYQLKISHLVMPHKLAFDCQELCSVDVWISFQRIQKGGCCVTNFGKKWIRFGFK